MEKDSNIFTWVKDNKVIVGAVVVGFFVLLVLFGG